MPSYKTHKTVPFEEELLERDFNHHLGALHLGACVFLWLVKGGWKQYTEFLIIDPASLCIKALPRLTVMKADTYLTGPPALAVDAAWGGRNLPCSLYSRHHTKIRWRFY